MSAAGESSGDLSGSPDQSENHVDQETSTEVTSSEFVNATCQLPAIVSRTSGPSREHGVSPSERNLEEHTKLHVGPFLTDSNRQDLHIELHSDIHAQEEKGTSRSREIHQQQTVKVNSSSDSRMKPPLSRRRSMSEGSTPHEENKIKQQASDDGSSEESYISLKQKYEVLERENEALKRKNEALERKNKKLEEEVVEHRRVTHKRAVLPKHVDEGVQTDQGMDCLVSSC